jgi:hypothetical protein
VFLITVSMRISRLSVSPLPPHVVSLQSAYYRARTNVIVMYRSRQACAVRELERRRGRYTAYVCLKVRPDREPIMTRRQVATSSPALASSRLAHPSFARPPSIHSCLECLCT